jgi:hypothetical protein
MKYYKKAHQIILNIMWTFLIIFTVAIFTDLLDSIMTILGVILCVITLLGGIFCSILLEKSIQKEKKD